MPSIAVEIDRDGRVKMEGVDFKGPACKVMEKIAAAAHGGPVDPGAVTLLPEFHQVAEQEKLLE